MLDQSFTSCVSSLTKAAFFYGITIIVWATILRHGLQVGLWFLTDVLVWISICLFVCTLQLLRGARHWLKFKVEGASIILMPLGFYIFLGSCKLFVASRQDFAFFDVFFFSCGKLYYLYFCVDMFLVLFRKLSFKLECRCTFFGLLQR